MTDDIISKIKDRIDIVELISSYLKLQKSGINYKARCPFHNEKTGSFFVSPERQIWHCFGCGKGGDAFGFIKEIEGMEFPEALRALAARAGVELTPRSPEYQQFQSAKTKLYEVTELATRFFEKQLWESASGRSALDYLQGRGMTDESIKKFRLGWAPDSWNSLTDFLGRNYSGQEIVTAGLAIKKDDVLPGRSGQYDRFRSRIMFPIFDISGQAVGFSGRIYFNPAGSASTTEKSSEDAAKYVNTPQTPIYDKSRILYGLDKAKLGIRQKNKCLVVEGNADVVMSHQAGADNAVASSGTALTDGHLKIIKRYTDNLDLCFDNDSAGDTATERGVDLALASGFNVGVVAISEDGIKDPADYVNKYGTDWAKFVASSQPFLEFFFEKAKKTFDITTASGKKMLTQKVLPFVAALASRIEQAHWVSEVAVTLKLKEEVVREEMVSVKPKIVGEELTETSLNSASTPSDKRLNGLEEGLVSIVLRKPELAVKIQDRQDVYLTDVCRNLIKRIGEAKEKSGNGIVDQLVTDLEPSAAMMVEFINLKSQELWKDVEENHLEAEAEKMLKQSKKQFICSRLAELEMDIKAAEKREDKQLVTTLAAEFAKISRELN